MLSTYPMAADTTDELERFRQQWRREVKEKSKAGLSSAPNPTFANLRERPNAIFGQAISRSTYKQGTHHDDSGEPDEFHGHQNNNDKNERGRLGSLERVHPSNRLEPTSALEHYERAVEREGEGNLGDSLSHYRKAYRLDAGVDRLYKNKHFPASSVPKPASPNPSDASVTVPNTAHHSLDGHPSMSISQLLNSCQYSQITRAEPASEPSIASLCPLASVPSEILIKIVHSVASKDPAAFARLAQVCRRLAYLVSTEDSIWRSICISSGYGFNAMHYSWTSTISGKPLPTTIEDLDARFLQMTVDHEVNSLAISLAYPSYRNMFQSRPRIRFNGCYISTVNYIRPGAATASQATWTSPVLIVTYYRYIRFFRDGTCTSLLTTSGPADVVHYLTKENLHTRHASGLPSAVMNHALRGRWKLSGNPYSIDVPVEDEGTVHVETEGADVDRPQPKYIYKLMLQLRSSSKSLSAVRNNKMTWLGYWSYNTLTDDWAEFNLKNDRAFFWSRVKSYGTGE